jgi:Cytochrome C'
MDSFVKRYLLGSLLLGLLAGQYASAQQQVPEDPRQLVAMPPLQQALLREEMLDNLGALNEIIGLVANDKLAEAGDVAEKRLGHSSMGKHAARSRGMGPGRFMPEAMRNIGLSMHDAASDFARTAKAGDRAAALAKLQQVTGACVACHAAFRTR